MAIIDTLVNISIQDADVPVSAESTSVPLLIANTDPGWTNADVVRAYGTVAELADDGFATTTDTYKHANLLMGGVVRPSFFLVGKKADAGAPGKGQKIKVDFSNSASRPNNSLTVTINGTSFTGNGSATDIAQSIASQFQAAPGVGVTIAYDDGEVFFEAEAEAGKSIDATDASSNFYRITTEQQAVGAVQGALTADDLNGFVAADNRFYGVIPVKASDADARILADWVESQDKLAWLSSADENNGDVDGAGSLAAYLQSKSYRRSSVLFSPLSSDKGIAAAWAGSVLPQVPGSINPAYRTLAGVSADSLSAGQVLATVGNLVEAEPGNRANVYISQYSKGITLAGTTGASTIYEVMGIDWLKFNMRAAVFSVLAGQKRALTDKDVNTFLAAVRGVLAQAVANGLVDPAPGKDDDGNDLPGITVTAPSVRSLTAAQRAAGRCPTISFTCTFAGPINAVAVRGTLVG